MPNTRLAAKAIIRIDNKYLLMTCELANGQQYHDLPGGKIEFGETPEEAVAREAREELNAEIQIERLLGYYQFLTINQQTHTTCLTFLCSLHNQVSDFNKEQNADLDEKVLDFDLLTKDELLKTTSNPSFHQLVKNNL